MDVLDVDLEKARKEQIAKNEARLQEHLGINVLPSATQHNASSSNTNTNSKGVKRGATKALSSAPKKAKTPTSTATQKQDQVRRSLRKQGQAPDAATAAGIRDEKGKGNIVLEDASALDHANAGSDSTASLKPSRPVGQLSLVPENREDVMDDTFMQDLHEQCELIPPKSTSINVASTATFARASLAEGDVCKVVPKGIVHMDFLPTLSQIVCAAGDKGGSIGIWKPGVNDAADGLYLQTVHGQYISGLRWSIHRASPSLITSSYDGSLRALDVHSQQCHELFVSKEGGGVSAFDLDTTGTTAIASDPSGSIARVDLRAGKEMDDPIDAHAKKINTVHIEPHAGNYVVTSSTDCTVRVWDARMLSKKATPVSEVDTKKSCQAALFSPSGSSEILTVSYNDRYPVHFL